MAEFRHFDLKIVSPSFGSSLTDLIIDLNYLRKKPLRGSTRPIIFFQLKYIFHMLESLASARIEGNNTTVADYIETKIDVSDKNKDAAYQEIQNIEECLEFIDANDSDFNIDRAFVSHLHKMVVKDLPTHKLGEGDKTPGAYRLENVSIKNSEHIPPESVSIPSYMDELFEFVAADDSPKYDLLKTAIAHHRFVWIHPFNNGNGRTVRMLTYAMLVKYGFNIEKGRILNPAAIFCSDRDKYYDKLALADSGTDQNILDWCEYVLSGLSAEIEKIDKLLEYDFLKERVLAPAISLALDEQWITAKEYKVLRKAVDKQIIKASDLNEIVSSKHLSDRSRLIRALRKKKMLTPISEGSRRYAISFKNNYLIRGLIRQLYKEGFVPLSDAS